MSQAHHTIPLRICSICGNASPLTLEHFGPSNKPNEHGFRRMHRKCRRDADRLREASPEWVGPSLADVREAERADSKRNRQSVKQLRLNTLSVRPVWPNG